MNLTHITQILSVNLKLGNNILRDTSSYVIVKMCLCKSAFLLYVHSKFHCISSCSSCRPIYVRCGRSHRFAGRFMFNVNKIYFYRRLHIVFARSSKYLRSAYAASRKLSHFGYRSLTKKIVPHFNDK